MSPASQEASFPRYAARRWSVPISNFANLAHALKDAGLKGIFFDNEQYFEQWANYPDGVAYAASNTMAEYQAQARMHPYAWLALLMVMFPIGLYLPTHLILQLIFAPPA